MMDRVQLLALMAAIIDSGDNSDETAATPRQCVNRAFEILEQAERLNLLKSKERK
jgi:hypothetical protein